MPTNHTGDKTLTQAPSPKPNPGISPIVVIPNDGEDSDAASISQALAATADLLDWLTKPQAKTADWAAPIVKYLSADGKQRWGIDHLGFPAGRLNHWREAWPAADTTGALTGTGGVSFGNAGWTISRVQTSGICRADVKDPDTNWSQRYVDLQTGDTANDVIGLWRPPSSRFTADSLIALEWDAKPAGLSGNTKYVMGFIGNLLPASGVGAWFEWPGSGTNWLCRSFDGSAFSQIDSGVAATTGWARFRIEYHGANVDDSAAERVLYFINGALVANKTTNMPSGGSPPNAQVYFQQLNITGTAGPWHFYLGNALLTANAWQNAF